ncbi:MAG: hypothetical protein HQK65_21765 [Desulfamplus sp.]|nr:hypothetical protein [Desulfamplus sp.]
MNPSSNYKNSFGDYLAFLFKSPLGTWWALATALVGFVGFMLTDDKIELNRFWLLGIILIVSFGLFVGFQVFLKGWNLYTSRNQQINILEIIRSEDEHIFVLKCPDFHRIGSFLEVYRVKELIEIPIGFIETFHQKEDGLIQAKPVWIMPIHLRDIESRELSVESLKAYPSMTKSTLNRWVDNEAESKIQDLFRKGMK